MLTFSKYICFNLCKQLTAKHFLMKKDFVYAFGTSRYAVSPLPYKLHIFVLTSKASRRWQWHALSGTFNFYLKWGSNLYFCVSIKKRQLSIHSKELVACFYLCKHHGFKLKITKRPKRRIYLTELFYFYKNTIKRVVKQFEWLLNHIHLSFF